MSSVDTNGHVTEAALVTKIPTPTEGGQVRMPLRRALLAIMTEERRPWHKRELFTELANRGWLPKGRTPDKQLTNRLSEMVERDELMRLRPGVYALKDRD